MLLVLKDHCTYFHFDLSMWCDVFGNYPQVFLIEDIEYLYSNSIKSRVTNQ